MNAVIFGYTAFELIFCALLALALTFHLDDHLEKRKLLKEELKKMAEKEENFD